jgi:hypothetical protein
MQLFKSYADMLVGFGSLQVGTGIVLQHARALGGGHDEGILAVYLLQQLIDGWI